MGILVGKAGPFVFEVKDVRLGVGWIGVGVGAGDVVEGGVFLVVLPVVDVLVGVVELLGMDVEAHLVGGL